MATYEEFLATKLREAPATGLAEVPDLNPQLFDFQREIVAWALRRGRSAIFADCGLGKTPMQLEWARHIPGRVLILAPLAVSQQTVREGQKFGIPVTYARKQTDADGQITITNYEMLGKFDPVEFAGVVLDESSILKSYSGKVKTAISEAFARTPYRLACTATPAPNDYMEIGNHSEFLGVMESNEMLARWFINDTSHFGRYRVKGHAVKAFWDWVSSWAVCFGKPSDIGYDDGDFVLPPLRTHRHTVTVDRSTPTPGMLFRLPEMSATGMHKEMRLTAPAKAAEIASLINGKGEPWVVWCHTNYEADALKVAIAGAVDLRGSESAAEKERKLLAFVDGNIQVLITKPDIAGFGMNWQHCRNQAFVGLSYSYEKYYQATRRSWRFGQESPVDVHLFMADTELPLYDAVFRKAAAHEEMKAKMYASLSTVKQLRKDLTLMDKPKPKRKAGDGWEMVLGDCCELVQDMQDGSVGFSIFSPPFSSLYIYSESMRDMGNSTDDDEFFDHFRFLVPELLRVTVPGRLCAVHCKQLVYYKNQRGTAGLRDFRGRIIECFDAAGWDYHSEVCIWKDPVTEMQRTKAHGLLHKQLCKDSTFSRQGLADYLLIFRKWAVEGDATEPVSAGDTELRFPAEYVGTDGPVDAKSERDHSIQVWQRYASPVWFDINPMNVLNVRAARDSKDEKHICPLQLDVISRALHLWTNAGDLVYSAFAGLGSEGYCAVKSGRRFVGHELKESYWLAGIENLRVAEHEVTNDGDLFQWAQTRNA